ncbi:DEAD/H helicase [Gloeopeniophorella convolvens]|nr:DEAD/H helicase [Gloeopeniophorella convolvens]
MQGIAGPSDLSSRKRKGVEVSTVVDSSKVTKRARKGKNSPTAAREANALPEPLWPDYFKELFKIFKALNTVLAFCTSRNQFATSFQSLCASIEGLLHRPLELEKVAEIKALLPDIMTFAYTPANHLKLNVSTQNLDPKQDVYSDYVETLRSRSSDNGDHVLTLEMDDSMVRKKRNPNDNSPFVPESLDPVSVKKLIEKRNALFIAAVDDLLEAFSDAEDPAALLKVAARDHIPLNASTNREGDPSQIPNPEKRPSIDHIVNEIYDQQWYTEQIMHRRTFEAKEGTLGTLDPPLSDAIQAALRDARSITSLYTHQADAITALSDGKDVIVSTSTASGKSVIYQVPLLRFLEQDGNAKAIFIYPTKALAQDQKAALEQLIACCPTLEHIFVSTYDGDTSQEARPMIRDTASVLFTNIDTIHASILPNEERWRRFFKNLRLVAVDELHYYHGMLGSHVALVMRRLRRICAAVGNRRVRFVSCSATISRPREHMMSIFGLEDVEAITEDGAPSGKKEFLLWTYSDQSSPTAEAARLMSHLMKKGVRVILFCKTRKSCELAMKAVRTTLSMQRRYDILEKVMPYRGGYQPSERRQIEREAFSGRLLGLVATNALELGVDIGVLDAVIVCGFPVTLASFRQQIGRAGRRARDALAVYIVDSSGPDSHYTQYPDDLFDKPTADLVVNLDIPLVIEAHLQCAAYEMPLSQDDERWFGPLTKSLCESKLVRDEEGWYHTHPKNLPHPARALSIRGADEDKYTVVDISNTDTGVKGRILEETEISRALFELYEGAIFLHQGKTFLVKEINHDSKQAKLIRTDVGWITTPRDFTDVDPIQTWRIREIKGSQRRALYGRVDVRTIVYGYHKVRLSDQRIIESVDVDMPPYENTTTGIWIDVSKKVLDFLDAEDIGRAAAVHSASHAFLKQFPMASDLRTECKAIEKENKAEESPRKRPARLIFYDVAGRSIGGVSAKAFDHVSDFLIRALEAVESCECSGDGCEGCILTGLCKEGNEVRSKRGALLVLRDVLGIPLGEPLPNPFGMDFRLERPLTVIEAPSVGVAENVRLEKYNA